MSLVNALKTLYAWKFDDLYRTPSFREIINKINDLESRGLVEEIKQIAEQLEQLPVNAENIHLIVLGKDLKQLL